MHLHQEPQVVANGHHSNFPSHVVSPQRSTFPRSKMVLRLALLVAVLGGVAAAAGLLWQGDGGSFSVTTIRDQAVEIYGRGLYRNDTLLYVGNNRSSDIVTLVFGIPLLAISGVLTARGSVRGRLILLGTLGFFVYTSATYALGGVAYNQMFLVYVALFASSLFAFVATFLTFDMKAVNQAFSSDLPRRPVGGFLIASGLITLGIWLMEPLSSLLSGEVPKTLETHTTLFTHAFDMAVIVPAAILAGVMILRRRLFGYVVAFSLLILEALLLPLITIATVVQIDIGIDFGPAEIAGPIAGFSLFAVLSLWVIVAVLRRVPTVHSQVLEVVQQ